VITLCRAYGAPVRTTLTDTAAAALALVAAKGTPVIRQSTAIFASHAKPSSPAPL